MRVSPPPILAPVIEKSPYFGILIYLGSHSQRKGYSANRGSSWLGESNKHQNFVKCYPSTYIVRIGSNFFVCHKSRVMDTCVQAKYLQLNTFCAFCKHFARKNVAKSLIRFFCPPFLSPTLACSPIPGQNFKIRMAYIALFV